MTFSQIFDVYHQVCAHWSAVDILSYGRVARLLWRISLKPHQRPHTHHLRAASLLVGSLLRFDAPLHLTLRSSTRTFQVLASALPVPSFIPSYHYAINEYLVFDLNISAIHAGTYILYYLTLEPLAAVCAFKFSGVMTTHLRYSYSTLRNWL
jgi:hypothetical protein